MRNKTDKDYLEDIQKNNETIHKIKNRIAELKKLRKKTRKGNRELSLSQRITMLEWIIKEYQETNVEIQRHIDGKPYSQVTSNKKSIQKFVGNGWKQ